MKKIMLVVVFLALALTCSAAKEVKKTAVKPAPPAVAIAVPVKEAVTPGILVYGFEEAKLPENLRGMTFLSSGGGQEQTVEDILTLELNKDAKFVKTGKQSLKIEYKMKPMVEGKFANISFSSKTTMGENTAFSFWVNKVTGKASVTVTVFDANWKKGVSQAITLTDGAKVVSLSAVDFTTGFNWAEISTIQLAVRGETLMYLDEVKFTAAAK